MLTCECRPALRIVCRTKASGGEKVGHVSVKVSGGEFGLSSQSFSYQVQTPLGFSKKWVLKMDGWKDVYQVLNRCVKEGKVSEIMS